ncbi:hypothetical protein VE25_09125 [Devosia geojensis]|uniref:Nucleotidyl transferase AbiEii/AbiGii toxin family protein n=1 Tax=Devosia geojensis TaxID=443610 RepID=A0A0F5FV98_9HYPH|nr:nucleotidyl transferase AbiEii/AbiGii toxin family protein [Devosia geojensis]KKB12087.1 hypothetical protein VE25_09125 [Devosia geojensis]
MTLTPLQKQVMNVIAANRSETSYMAGGAVLNKDWFRVSDDLDIFHDTDEEIVDSARADITALKAAGFDVHIDVLIYGVVECTVSRNGSATMLQWMSETKIRFFPLVRDKEWGVRLNTADLAINKVMAASTRSKARDYVDLITIAENYCKLGPLIMAASGKPPNFSPQKIIDETRRRSLSIPAEEFLSVRGLPIETTVDHIRDSLSQALDQAEAYIHAVEPVFVGLLSLDRRGVPVEVTAETAGDLIFRRATAEPEAVPGLPGKSPGFEP